MMIPENRLQGKTGLRKKECEGECFIVSYKLKFSEHFTKGQVIVNYF